MTREEFQNRVVVHHPSMYRVAVALTRDADEAADLVQETMVRLWVSRDRLDDVENMAGYCLGALRNRFVDTVRSHRTTASLSAVEADDSLTLESEQTIDNRSALSLVGRIIDKLPTNQRTVIRLSTFGGCSNDEIVRITGLSEGNVRTLLSRARKTIKNLYLENTYI